MNLNKLARDITLKEGLKQSVSIAQVKEILRITLKELAHLQVSELINVLKKYE